MANDLVMRYQFESYMGCKEFSGAGVYAITIGGTLATSDKIYVSGIETVLDATSSASGTAAATAVKASVDANAAFSAKYSTSKSDNVITITEKSGHYGEGKPSASIVSTAGTVAVSVTTPPATTDAYKLIGEGFTSFPEQMNPQEYTRKYINYKTEKTDVIGYAPSVEYSCDVISDDPVVQEIVKIHDNELVGNETHRDVVNVNKWQPVSGSDVTFEAYKRTYAIVPGQKGEGTDALVYTGTFRAVSDIVKGTFNTQTKTFSAA